MARPSPRIATFGFIDIPLITVDVVGDSDRVANEGSSRNGRDRRLGRHELEALDLDRQRVGGQVKTFLLVFVLALSASAGCKRADVQTDSRPPGWKFATAPMYQDCQAMFDGCWNGGGKTAKGVRRRA